MPESEPYQLTGRVVTDLREIERRGNELVDQNLRFRAWIKWRGDVDQAELDALVRRITDAVWREVDCTACGQCCRALYVVVDGEDTRRLAAHLGQSPAAFAREYLREHEGDKGFAAQPCPFLEGNACSVYEHRPRACRDFPYLHEEEFRSRTLMHVENTMLCPVVFNTMEELKRVLPWRKPRSVRRRRA